MRNLKSYLSFLLFAFIAFASCDDSKTEKTSNSSGKITELPVTTKSADAKAAFQEGLMYVDENDLQKARVSLTKAIQLDSNLAIAYIFRSNTANSSKEFADDLAKAKTHLDGASDWEKMYYDLYNT